MVDDLEDFWIHWVIITRPGGDGPEGALPGIPEARLGFYDDTRKLVRDASGAEVLSSARVMLPAGVAEIPLDTMVKSPESFGAKESRVISVSVRDSGDLDLPDHVELFLE